MADDTCQNIRVDTAKSWAMLKEIVLRNTPPHSGTCQTGVNGLAFHRQTSDQEPRPHFYQPVIIVVIQGKKLVRIGVEEYRYGERICFICGVDVPVASCAMEASEEMPYLSLSLYLDTGMIADLAAKVPPSRYIENALPRAAMIQNVEPDLLDALLRLAELTEKPDRIPVLEELLLREIHFHLLASPFGRVLRTLNTFGSQGNQIIKAIAWLKTHFTEPLQVEALAEKSNMAPATFHRHFKEITTLSPLQYQKRLRLAEAQRLMLSEGHDVQRAAHAVGYESDTQFIREYKRLFGEPPRRNVLAIRSAGLGGQAAAAF